MSPVWNLSLRRTCCSFRNSRNSISWLHMAWYCFHLNRIITNAHGPDSSSWVRNNGLANRFYDTDTCCKSFYLKWRINRNYLSILSTKKRDLSFISKYYILVTYEMILFSLSLIKHSTLKYKLFAWFHYSSDLTAWSSAALVNCFAWNAE
jgi:hypothetical protein